MLTDEQRDALKWAIDVADGILAISRRGSPIREVETLRTMLAASAAPADGREAGDERVKWPYAITRGDVECLICDHQRGGQKHLNSRLNSSGSYLIRVAETFRWCLEQIDEARAALATAPTEEMQDLHAIQAVLRELDQKWHERGEFGVKPREQVIAAIRDLATTAATMSEAVQDVLFEGDDEQREFWNACDDFASCNETSVDYRLLMKWANSGLLECTHFEVTSAGNAEIERIDRANSKEGS